jgi:hypothetical protein
VFAPDAWWRVSTRRSQEGNMELIAWLFEMLGIIIGQL